MDQVHIVRHKVWVEGLSVREVARQLGLARNTVRRYLRGAPPSVRASTPRAQPVTTAVGPRARALLEDSKRWTTRKQKLTASRLHQLLRQEGFVVGYTSVKQIVREHRRAQQEVFVPLVYKPGDLAEVDFFEVQIELEGVRQKVWMFLLRLMYSGRDFAWLYPRQDQVCFLDGHVRAFAHFGAAPQRVLYDNLKPAVVRVLVGAARVLTERMLALAAHYGFEPCFARPYTGHDKGGVEARGKTIRWQHLVPVPHGPSRDAISSALMSRLQEQAQQKRATEEGTAADRFEHERLAMIPLPTRPYRAAAVAVLVVSRRALIKVEGALYSVWSTWTSMRVTVHVGVDQVEIVGPDATIQHVRVGVGARSVDYRHYVRELARKPQAVRQVADELVRDLGPPFDQAWRSLVELHGPKQAAPLFARVLGAIEELGMDAARARVEHALASGISLAWAMRSTPPPIGVPTLPAPWVGIEVSSSQAADYDILLAGGER